MVAGQVQDSYSQVALSGVSLCAFPVPPDPDYGSCDVSEEGEFAVEGLLDGDYELVAAADGYYDASLFFAIDGLDVLDELVELDRRVWSDFDLDTDVDADDWAHLEGCIAGPMAGIGEGCELTDLDGDYDVDLADLAAFQCCFSGSGIPADPGCE